VKEGHSIEEWIDNVARDASRTMETDYHPVAIRVYLVSPQCGGLSATLIADNRAFNDHFGDEGAGERD